ncbi:MAG: hypothetical protein HGA65_17140, partial [Oscillochloris sp.]|nr:hypothetical protein [Oscillochloris sp.]
PSALPISYIRRRLGVANSSQVLSCSVNDRQSLRDVLLALLDQVAQVQNLDAA